MINIITNQNRDSKYDPSIADAVNREVELEEKKAKLEEKIKPEADKKETQISENSGDFKREGYIYVPSTKLYVAKERTLQGKNWEETHREIIPKGFVMQTPYEFMTFLTYLKDSKNIPDLKERERKEILDDILKTGDWRGEWLNAKFVKQKESKDLDVSYVTGMDKKGSLITKQEPLEACLNKDAYSTFNLNKQGLLTQPSGDNSYKQGKNIYFWYPRENTVARFLANSDRAGLLCNWSPDYLDAGLGVRLAIPTKINLGGLTQ